MAVLHSQTSRTPHSGVTSMLRAANRRELHFRAPFIFLPTAALFIAVTCLDLLLPLWFDTYRLPPAVRPYLIASDVLTVVAACVAALTIRRLDISRHESVDGIQVVTIAIIACNLLMRSVPKGGDDGLLLGATCLTLLIFGITLLRPLRAVQAFVAAVLVWMLLPLAQVITPLLTGEPVPPPSFAAASAARILLVAIASVAMSTAGAALLHGLRRRRHEAEQAVRYRLHDQIGEGGMGEVYAATHGTLKCRCAVKVCAVPEGMDLARAHARFEREAQEVARLHHPNIVQIFDYGELDDGRLYYAMEYLPGIDLASWSERYGRVSEARLLYWAEQILGGLAAAHRAGVVHRDLKPANLMVSSLDGEPDVVKILDFGLIKRVKEPVDPAISQADEAAGTPWYMAPEQIQHVDSIDGRTDLYALGAVLWHLAAGRPVFEGRTAVSVLIQHIGKEAPRLDEYADVSVDFADFVATLLAKKPSERFSSAVEARTVLRLCSKSGDWTCTNAEGWWLEHGSSHEELCSDALPTAPLPTG